MKGYLVETDSPKSMDGKKTIAVSADDFEIDVLGNLWFLNDTQDERLLPIKVFNANSWLSITLTAVNIEASPK